MKVSNQMIREGTRREMTSVAVWKGIQLVSQMQITPVRLARYDELHAIFRRSASCESALRCFSWERKDLSLKGGLNKWKIQLNDPQMQDVPFPDRFGMLVDAEYTNRKNNSLKRLIKGASLNQAAMLEQDAGTAKESVLPYATYAKTYV